MLSWPTETGYHNVFASVFIAHVTSHAHCVAGRSNQSGVCGVLTCTPHSAGVELSLGGSPSTRAGLPFPYSRRCPQGLTDEHTGVKLLPFPKRPASCLCGAYSLLRKGMKDFPNQKRKKSVKEELQQLPENQGSKVSPEACCGESAERPALTEPRGRPGPGLPISQQSTDGSEPVSAPEKKDPLASVLGYRRHGPALNSLPKHHFPSSFPICFALDFLNGRYCPDLDSF